MFLFDSFAFIRVIRGPEKNNMLCLDDRTFCPRITRIDTNETRQRIHKGIRVIRGLGK